VATHTQPQETQHTQPDPSLIRGLAMVGGLGLTLIVIALGFGVVGGEQANSNLVGLGVLSGALILLVAIVAWFGVVQPHKHFDDINQPLEDDHGHGHAEDAHAEDLQAAH